MQAFPKWKVRSAGCTLSSDHTRAVPCLERLMLCWCWASPRCVSSPQASLVHLLSLLTPAPSTTHTAATNQPCWLLKLTLNQLVNNWSHYNLRACTETNSFPICLSSCHQKGTVLCYVEGSLPGSMGICLARTYCQGR